MKESTKALIVANMCLATAMINAISLYHAFTFFGLVNAAEFIYLFFLYLNIYAKEINNDDDD